MKLFGKIALGLALGLVALSGSDASAATICNGCDYSGTSQYLGAHSPVTSDQSTYVHNAIGADFSDTWVFDINPAGLANLTATFNPTDAISGFTVTLYNVTASSGCNVDTVCTSVTLGGAIGSNTPGSFALALQNQNLASGRYAFVIGGNILQTTSTRSYSGNLSVFQRVPEPASLGLMGFALMAGAVALRRRKQTQS